MYSVRGAGSRAEPRGRAMMRALVFVLAFVAIPATAMATGEEEYAFRRQLLILEIEDSVRDTSGYIGKAKLDDRVMAAMAKVPRHEFVPDGERAYAYENRPVPIGYGQTISQPYIVALMTEALGLRGPERVLEIGTGSGYQAAILAQLCAEVVTIERLAELSTDARAVIAELGFENIDFWEGDGTLGCEQRAPFDGIIVTAAAPHVPQTLMDQLAPGGRLVIPVGPEDVQQLLCVEKTEQGPVTRELCGCRFVKLIGADGWPAE